MKKAFLFLLFFIISVNSYAQMDTEHWFAPMGNNTTLPSNYQSIYLSTKETVPFEVKIYNGNTLLGTKSISKGKSEIFDIPRQYIITDNKSDRMVILNKGLHLVGEKKYFANLRFSATNHAEIVTSKGLAGLGKEFYLGMPQVNFGTQAFISNHTASIIATENSTTVTLSGYEPSLVFTNDSSPLSAEKTIILNKGESYIFEVENNQNFGKGLIGAKITSDKALSVSCGSFSGRIADTGVDIFMDQSIPVEKTGREFIVMSGNGKIPSIMEQTLVIATDDNTQIFLNNNKSSVPDYTISKAGDSLFIKSEKYFPVSVQDNLYGLHITTSKNVYIYQLLAGSSLREEASGGMNLIPALSCFLPSKIEELSDVDKNQVYTSSEGNVTNHSEVKINIIAQANADIYVNDTKTGLLGPYPVLGSSEWEVYTLLGAKGNITVESKNGKAVTAGIAGGSTNVGFGGYFAGFSSVPAISKTGDCANGQQLVVDDIYDIYEWTYSPDDTVGSYVPYPGNSYSINPGGKFGYYKCTVTKTSCSPLPITTKSFKYLKCTEFTAVDMDTIGNCKSIPVIIPAFKKDPSIIIDTSKTFISQKPVEGVAYVDASGAVHFDASGSALEQVTFKYYFEGFGAFPDSEEVTVTVNIAQIKLKNTEQTQCLDDKGEGIYNLKLAFKTVNPDPYKTYSYYSDYGLTQKIPDVLTESYPSKPNNKIYVVVTNIYDCDNRNKPAEILLKTFELPTINTIEVSGTDSVTINVSQGTPGYYFYIKKNGKETDFIPESAYTYLDKLPARLPINDGKGSYRVYVKSADNCSPVSQNFSVIGISNIITPNDDGANDSIDYSDLMTKLDPRFEVYDRNGKVVFRGSPENHYIWNGKSASRELPTSSYWYLLEWNESSTSQRTQKSGWILLKNRN
ncbi:T9SS type B sorting domain-containing protein [Epilithonimonas sp.]|uniref:T9SS type B sorting domain-containing protein n=1 Tax=Epilithonimonas sp. TaxID=2894511 RepID=UPI002899FC23|nr:T9SS type B sorting domain-containing protein [Epilithonimonas sp.]